MNFYTIENLIKISFIQWIVTQRTSQIVMQTTCRARSLLHTNSVVKEPMKWSTNLKVLRFLLTFLSSPAQKRNRNPGLHLQHARLLKGLQMYCLCPLSYTFMEQFRSASSKTSVLDYCLYIFPLIFIINGNRNCHISIVSVRC